MLGHRSGWDTLSGSSSFISVELQPRLCYIRPQNSPVKHELAQNVACHGHLDRIEQSDDSSWCRELNMAKKLKPIFFTQTM